MGAVAVTFTTAAGSISATPDPQGVCPACGAVMMVFVTRLGVTHHIGCGPEYAARLSALLVDRHPPAVRPSERAPCFEVTT